MPLCHECLSEQNSNARGPAQERGSKSHGRLANKGDCIPTYGPADPRSLAKLAVEGREVHLCIRGVYLGDLCCQVKNMLYEIGYLIIPLIRVWYRTVRFFPQPSTVKGRSIVAFFDNGTLGTSHRPKSGISHREPKNASNSFFPAMPRSDITLDTYSTRHHSCFL
jgi:hypothetical protein